MDINVALQAVRELLQYDVTMRLAMTLLTLWHKLMLGMMAFYAGNLAMFACSCLDFLPDCTVAGTADIILNCVTIFDDEWCMYRMTCQTILNRLI